MKKFKNFLNELISAIYPNKCICCSEIIAEGDIICEKCNALIERNNLEDFCFLCGHEKSDCVCKYNVYRFDKLICVFKNINLARNAYYSYKFSKKQHYARFFSREMSNAVKEFYKDIDFDYICAVPSATRYGYDHSGYLAKEMSRILEIKFIDNILSCAKKAKKQHKSTISDRLKNVEGKYKYNMRIENARILLIDDVKTTGATLDECAKMLLYAGAQSVYCVTALVSHKE